MVAVLITAVYAAVGSALSLGRISGPTAVVAALGLATAASTAALVARALDLHSGTGSFSRGVGFLSMGVLAGGLSMIVGVIASGPRVGYLVVAGMTASAGFFLLGLLLLPGAAPTAASRLRRVLDGAAIGVCLFVAGWTLVVAPLTRGRPGPVSPVATTAILLVLLLSVMLSVTVLTVTRAVRHRTTALLCGVGVTVALLQQSITAMLLLLDARWPAVLSTTAVWTVGPGLVWLGARRPVRHTTRGRAAEAGTRSRFAAAVPLLWASAAVALFGAFYQLMAYGPWDLYTAMLATAAAAVVGLRGLFAALEVSRYAARLRVQETRFLTTDPLTGIPNRLRLRHRLDLERAKVRVDQRCGTLLVVDLDGFGEIDEVRGHDVADTVLMEVARRLRLAVGPDDLAVRLAGDAFAVLSTGPPRHADALASRLRARLAEPYRPCGNDPSLVQLTASIGIAECNAAATVDEMIRCAELAVCQARERGGDRAEHYDESLELRMLRRHTFSQELRRVLALHADGLPGPEAMDREQPDPGGDGGQDPVPGRELDLLFSPVVELPTGIPVGVCAHVRWLHPTLGEVPEADLVAAAEDTGLSGEIGNLALRRACRQLGAWVREGRDVRMSVKVCSAQLCAPGFPGRVARLRREFGIPAGRLLVELSEHGLPSPGTIAAPLAELRDAGVRTGLAEFGTGSCPLIDLPALPLDVLRIDDSLVTRLDESVPVVATVAGLARRLGLDLVADGVRERCQADLLEAMGCRYAQGPVFSRPLPVEHAEEYLDAHAGGAGSASLRR